jgi:uncharacterized protein (DUF2147 family)
MRIVKAALICAALVMFGTVPGFAQSADDVIGTWRHPDNGSHIRIAKCGAGVCATVVKVAEAGRKDVNNPDPKLRTRPVQGVTIMSGAKKTGDKTWSGKLYNTQDGKTYNGTLTVVDKSHLKLEGCVLGGLICQGPTWTRVE